MEESKYQSGFLLQKTLNLQELAQLQHQRNICEIIFSAVSSAEKVALKLSKNKEYKLYDPFNSSSFKNDIQLENELATKLIYLKSGLIAFKMQHGDFIFPDTEIKKEMINDINKWSKLITNRPKALESYKTLLQLIEGETIEIPNNCFHETNFKSNENSTIAFAEGMMKKRKILDDQDLEVRNDYEKTGNHKVPFKKEKNNNNDVKESINKFIQDEKNVENYLSTLINNIQNNKNISKSDDSKMSNYIKNLKNSIENIEVDEKYSNKKLIYYNNMQSNALAMIEKNKNYELILLYCHQIHQMYYETIYNY